MSSPEILFHIDGADRLSRVLERASLGMAPEGLLVMNKGISDELEAYFEKNWPMRVPPDLPQTATRWPDSTLLYNTGALKESMTKKTPNSVRVITPYEIRFGTSLVYGRFINDGTKKMPTPRPFLRVTPKMTAMILATVKEYVGFSPDLRFKSGFRPY